MDKSKQDFGMEPTIYKQKKRDPYTISEKNDFDKMLLEV